MTMPDLRGTTDAARERAAASGRTVLATVSVPADGHLALPDHPDAGLWIEPGFAAAGAGVAAEAVASGQDRFDRLATELDRRFGDAVADGGRPFAFTGGAFAQGDGWPGFPDARAWIPEIALVRDASGTRLVATVAVAPDDDGADERLRELLEAGLPGPSRGGLAAAPYATFTPDNAAYEAAVQEALDAIEDGTLAKVVLARRMRMRSAAGISPSALADALAERYPACFTFAQRRGDLAFVGASPELLVAREERTVRATPAAGTVADSAQPSESRKLAGGLDTVKARWEQELVADAVYDVLEPLCEEVSTHLPMVVPAGPVQHLATTVEGRLREPIHVLELVRALHPTPAVGGVPLDEARSFIDAHEGFDRGWYAGPIGIARPDGSGSFALALRCALIAGNDLDLFAGAGIVEGSIPREERQEIDLKLGAVAAVLTPES